MRDLASLAMQCKQTLHRLKCSEKLFMLWYKNCEGASSAVAVAAGIT